ncbi:MAG: hypothetical protein KatS3mg087_2006 [Patescibacteria group bacterium]|nr:MAG: hypothetical protein KatS3mg087_2006 [Patescibacteria group bacterium]
MYEYWVNKYSEFEVTQKRIDDLHPPHSSQNTVPVPSPIYALPDALLLVELKAL